MPDTHVKVSYEAFLEEREGNRVLMLVRYEDTTPISNRGREYNRSTTTHKVYVWPLDEVNKIMSELVSTLVWTARAAANDPDKPHDFACNVRDKKRYQVLDLMRTALDDSYLFWSYDEAEEFVEGFMDKRDTRGWTIRVQDDDGEVRVLRRF